MKLLILSLVLVSTVAFAKTETDRCLEDFHAPVRQEIAKTLSVQPSEVRFEDGFISKEHSVYRTYSVGEHKNIGAVEIGFDAYCTSEMPNFISMKKFQGIKKETELDLNYFETLKFRRDFNKALIKIK